MLLALVSLYHRGGDDPLDEVIAHIGEGGVAVKPAFGLHLDYAVLEQLALVLDKLQLVRHAGVALD